MNADLPARVLLADGAVGLVRALGPADAGAVLALHTRLDERDRYFRFFGPLPSTMDRLAARIAGGPGEDHTGLRSPEALWASGLDRAAGSEALLEVARLAALVPELAELDLNPVAVHAAGCVAVDVRVRLERRESAGPFLRRLPG